MQIQEQSPGLRGQQADTMAHSPLTEPVVTWDIADADSLDLTDGMTLEAWVYVTSKSGTKTVISKGKPSGKLAYALYVKGLRPVALISFQKKKYNVKGTTKLSLNTWTHLAATYDGVTLQLYVDGNQVKSKATKGESIEVSSNPVRIGNDEIAEKKQFRGTIDEVRIYNRALTQTEIQTDMGTPLSGLDNAPPTDPRT